MADSQKKSAQLFDWSAVTTGYRIQWNTGDVYADTTAIMSDYIPITGITYRANASYICIAYDSEKNYLGTYDPITHVLEKQYNAATTYFAFDVTRPSYIRLLSFSSIPDQLSSTTMFNAGSTQLPFQPYSSTGWLHSLRKLTTATEAVENPLYSDGSPITAYTIKGNTVQDGTPTPSNPVDVNGVGERTANLCNGWEYGNIDTSGNEQASNTEMRTGYIPIDYNKIFSISREVTTGYWKVRIYDENKDNSANAFKRIFKIFFSKNDKIDENKEDKNNEN